MASFNPSTLFTALTSWRRERVILRQCVFDTRCRHMVGLNHSSTILLLQNNRPSYLVKHVVDSASPHLMSLHPHSDLSDVVETWSGVSEQKRRPACQ
jgi:hypothetical protein